jgi:rare lipoprotein A
MKTKSIAVLGVLLLVLSACAAKRSDGGELQIVPPVPVGGQDVSQTGVASWYGDDFQGKATADGEIYDMHKLTAAHPDLPFHTLVEVENVENGRKVLVRINDRGPFLKERIIDLSLKAAQRLGIEEKGTARVNLRVLRRGGDRPAPAAAPAPGRRCRVQAGAFAVRENAEALLLTLADIFPDLAFRVEPEEGIFKVLSPELASAEACGELLQRLALYHLEGFARESSALEEN